MLEKGHPYSVWAQAGGGELKGLAGVFVSFWLQEVVVYWKETFKMAMYMLYLKGKRQ